MPDWTLATRASDWRWFHLSACEQHVETCWGAIDYRGPEGLSEHGCGGLNALDTESPSEALPAACQMLAVANVLCAKLHVTVGEPIMGSVAVTSSFVQPLSASEALTCAPSLASHFPPPTRPTLVVVDHLYFSRPKTIDKPIVRRRHPTVVFDSDQSHLPTPTYSATEPASAICLWKPLLATVQRLTLSNSPIDTLVSHHLAISPSHHLFDSPDSRDKTFRHLTFG